MIYVTHDQVEAMTLADKIVVLDAGRVAQVGKPLELYHYPAAVSYTHLDVYKRQDRVLDAIFRPGRVSESERRAVSGWG